MFKRGVFIGMVTIFAMLFIQACGVTSPYVTGAKIDMQNKDYKKATEKLNLAIKNNSKDYQAYYLLGKIYAKEKKYEDMVSMFKKSTKINKEYEKDINAEIEAAWVEVIKDANASYKSGLNFLNNNKPEEKYKKAFSVAVKKGEQAAILMPEKYENYMILIYSYYYLGDYDKSLKHAQKLYELKPGDIQSLKNIAVIYLGKGDLDKANEYYVKAYEIDKNDKDVISRIAAYNIEKENFDKALEMYDALLTLDPKNTTVLYNKGLLLYQKKQDVNGAIAAFRKILDNKKDDLEVTLILSEILVEEKRYDEAISLILPNIESFEADSEMKKRAYDSLFFAYSGKGDNMKAKKYFIE
ncbi:MAG: hypothetical protein CR982_04825 [Candidatus Cloacimonadota bacterium]|nr:MAG: hypothetical protein CR982_04825 [Candidatus Cloacimonadota bacterium]PIE77442.1 MAG: hypothetical protein CSA15_12920 [Candidatus Delongbacteria bacterium]